MESDSEPEEDDEIVTKRLKLIREQSELERPASKRFIGGVVVSSDANTNNMSSSASLSASEKKGLKEVEELERELDLKNTFSKETNRRDQDAEMNKYIDEQIRLRRDAAKKDRQNIEETSRKDRRAKEDDDLSGIFTLPAEELSQAEVVELLHLECLLSLFNTDFIMI